MKKHNIEPKFIRGRRVTDEQTLQIVIDVLVNEINYEIVTQLRRLGAMALGVHYGSVRAFLARRCVA